MAQTRPGFAPHNHRICISSSLDAADEICSAGRAQMTPVRRKVLELLLEDHRALGAYDVLARLKAEGFASQPPVAYRALDFLVSHGLAHRIEKRSAYVACAQMGACDAPGFLICRGCDRVAETRTEMPDSPLAHGAAAAGFTIETAVQEAEGLCPACSGSTA